MAIIGSTHAARHANSKAPARASKNAAMRDAYRCVVTSIWAKQQLSSSSRDGGAAWRFEHGIGRILRVSKEELAKREAAYRDMHDNKQGVLAEWVSESLRAFIREKG